MAGPAFSRMMKMIPILRDFHHTNRQKFFKNWQTNTSEVNLDLYGEHMIEERITGSKIDLDLSARSTNT